MVKVKLTRDYLKRIKVNSDGIYEVEEQRAKELVEAGNAEYLDKPVEVKENKIKKTKEMKPRKKRTYKTK